MLLKVALPFDLCLYHLCLYHMRLYHLRLYHLRLYHLRLYHLRRYHLRTDERERNGGGSKVSRRSRSHKIYYIRKRGLLYRLRTHQRASVGPLKCGAGFKVWGLGFRYSPASICCASDVCSQAAAWPSASAVTAAERSASLGFRMWGLRFREGVGLMV
jgi:hypothetical protein